MGLARMLAVTLTGLAGHIVDVEALREDGKVVIEYGRSALEADPQVLEDTMREAADRARDAIPDLEDVEFRVGDRTFTF